LSNLAHQQRSRRVLFVNANETTRPYRVAPLGLAFVATAAERAGCDVRFVDQPQTAAGRRQFNQVLRNWQPGYVALGIRNLDNSDFHALETYLDGPARLIRAARKLAPRAKIIVGGPAGTVEPERVATTVACDHLVLGEGELALPQLIARLEAGETVPRIVGADDNGTPFRVVNTSALPAPALHRWVDNFDPYLRGDAGYPVQTKRGCPLKCTYCTYGRIEGVRYRFLSPEAIADEIEGALGRGVRDFEFVDSTFNLPVRHALEVLQTLRDRNLQANYIGTGLNPSQLPDPLLASMRELGFRSVILTAESASNRMLASYKKIIGATVCSPRRNPCAATTSARSGCFCWAVLAKHRKPSKKHFRSSPNPFCRPTPFILRWASASIPAVRLVTSWISDACRWRTCDDASNTRRCRFIIPARRRPPGWKRGCTHFNVRTRRSCFPAKAMPG
jgi:hypothetical protein